MYLPRWRPLYSRKVLPGKESLNQSSRESFLCIAGNSVKEVIELLFPWFPFWMRSIHETIKLIICFHRKKFRNICALHRGVESGLRNLWRHSLYHGVNLGQLGLNIKDFLVSGHCKPMDILQISSHLTHSACWKMWVTLFFFFFFFFFVCVHLGHKSLLWQQDH